VLSMRRRERAEVQRPQDVLDRSLAQVVELVASETEANLEKLAVAMKGGF